MKTLCDHEPVCAQIANRQSPIAIGKVPVLRGLSFMVGSGFTVGSVFAGAWRMLHGALLGENDPGACHHPTHSHASRLSFPPGTVHAKCAKRHSIINGRLALSRKR